MNLLIEPLGDPLTTSPIQTGWEFTMEPYLSGQFGFIDDPDRQFGNGLVWTRTRTRSDGPEPLLTVFFHNPSIYIIIISKIPCVSVTACHQLQDRSIRYFYLQNEC